MPLHKTCYLDYNATTIMPKRVQEAMLKWMNRGNASSIYPSAKAAKRLMGHFRDEIAHTCGFSLEGEGSYSIIFTSGGSEANTFIITSIVRSYLRLTGKRPHFITSNVEHDNIMILCKDLVNEDVDVTYVKVKEDGEGIGSVDPEDVYKAIRPNTCLISIMSANNETGVRNDIRSIGYVAKGKKIPFFTDAVQTFGKEPLRPNENNITAFSGSFHKMHGPTGTGVAVISNALIAGYDLKSMIPGHQNGGMRGGTECIHNIAAARESFQMTFENRTEKTKLIFGNKMYLIHRLKTILPIISLNEYRMRDNVRTPIVVTIGPDESTRILPGTLLMSVYMSNICNTKMREYLADHHIFVSIGSACKTGQAKASHVLDAMGVPKELVPGVLRVSIGEYTTKEELDRFISYMYKIISEGKCKRDKTPNP